MLLRHLDTISTLIERSDEQIIKVGHLLEMSEERIDKTNVMIGKMQDLVGKLTDEYTKHLASVQEQRDELTRQNTKLLEIHYKDIDTIKKYRDEKDKFIDRIFSLTTELAKKNNINVSNGSL